MSSWKLVVVVLATLFVVNAFWVVLSGSGDPVTFAALYGFAWLLGARLERYVPVLVMGVLGFALHVYEIAVGRTETYSRGDDVFLYLNLLLPIILVAVSVRAMREKSRHQAGG
jgi:hypothetical protein